PASSLARASWIRGALADALSLFTSICACDAALLSGTKAGESLIALAIWATTSAPPVFAASGNSAGSGTCRLEAGSVIPAERSTVLPAVFSKEGGNSATMGTGTTTSEGGGVMVSAKGSEASASRFTNAAMSGKSEESGKDKETES